MVKYVTKKIYKLDNCFVFSIIQQPALSGHLEEIQMARPTERPNRVEFAYDLIGYTPVVRLSRIVPKGSAKVYVKLESANPGGSVKDRIALSMIQDAETKGVLKAGMTLLEATSGNTGIGLAFVAATKGYKITLVMPDTMTQERRSLLKAYGAELLLTPGSGGMKAAVDKAQELAASLKTLRTPKCTVAPLPSKSWNRCLNWTPSSLAWAPAAPSPAWAKCLPPRSPVHWWWPWNPRLHPC
jgi:Pyridoxal-phosphate dependent enzyme